MKHYETLAITELEREIAQLDKDLSDGKYKGHLRADKGRQLRHMKSLRNEYRRLRRT